VNAPALHLVTLATPAGSAHAVITPEDGALRLFGWGDPDDNLSRLSPSLLQRGIERSGARASAVRPVVVATGAYGDGDVDALRALDVAQPGGEFFQDAWAALRGVEPGQRVTYSELAVRAGRPAAVRAAASACARNLVALVVPCHRAVRRDGGLGGFYYGLDIKRVLLAHEERHRG
jgi:methylated-DNA-[protein]-cysteine S-methyltransferase